MSRQIKVTSFRALEELEVAIGRFSSRSIEALEEAERQITRKRDLLDQIVNERKRSVAYWRQEYDSADPDEDDVSSISHHLEEAEDALGEAKRWQRRIEDSYNAYSRKARDGAHLCTEHTLKARAFLKQKIKELYEYVSLQPDSINEGIVGDGISGPGLTKSVTTTAEVDVERNVTAVELGANDLTSFLLPKGFKWIRLDEIDPAEMDLLSTDLEFRKMSEQEITSGMELLKTRILPEIQRDPVRVDSDYFAGIDRTEGRYGTNSLENIYRAFFGTNDQMWVDRTGGDYYRVGNGKHRIKVARELNWPAIPAEVHENHYRVDAEG